MLDIKSDAVWPSYTPGDLCAHLILWTRDIMVELSLHVICHTMSLLSATRNIGALKTFCPSRFVLVQVGGLLSRFSSNILLHSGPRLGH